jgi:colicin import membrane protein
MIDNEDSVVTSLNELRKLKNERISRQTQSRPASSGNRAVALAEDPLADQVTPPPVQASVAAHAPSAFEQNAAFAPAANRFAPAFDPQPQMQAPPVVVTKTSYKAAIIMTILLGGAGAAGYMKLQQDTQALLAAKEAAIKSAEDARMRSVEASAKAEQVTKTNLRQCEDKLKASMAAAASAPAAPAAAAVVAPAEKIDKKAEKAERIAAAKAEKAEKAAAAKAAKAARHAAARPAKAAGPATREPKEPKEAKEKADVPTIAKKKKVDNDPLAGLGKL